MEVHMKKTLLAVLLIASFILTAMPAAFALDTGSIYSDISGKWFESAAAKYGYPEIFSDGTTKFNPDREITRIEFTRLLHKALGISINYFAAPDVKDHFNDVDNSEAGASALIDLCTAGIIESGGSFNPEKQLDRDTMIHWIMNALKVETGGNYAIPMVKPMPFGDDAEIKDAYRSEIYSAVVLKLVNGRGNNLLFPKDGATRAEAVTVVSRLTSLLESYRQTVDVSASAELADGKLTMSLKIRNSTDKAITIRHTSGQKFDFKLFDDKGENVYTWSADKMFITLVNETKINPGEQIVFSDTLQEKENAAVGSASTMTAFLIGSSEDFTIDPDGYTAVIAK
jgi:hypothetical protein